LVELAVDCSEQQALEQLQTPLVLPLLVLELLPLPEVPELLDEPEPEPERPPELPLAAAVEVKTGVTGELEQPVSNAAATTTV
jgi:hypothetical protein